MSKPVVYMYHILYAEGVQEVAAVMENVIANGVDEVKATLVNDSLYKIEYKLPREDKESGAQ